jgi:hypothetical protein
MRMVASSNQQETVMNTHKFEMRALSDDQLDAVAGGFFAMGLANQVTQVVRAGQGGDSGSGGQKDPLAQMFQQLLQQLT